MDIRRERSVLSAKSGSRFRVKLEGFVTSFTGGDNDWTRIELSTRGTPMLQDTVTITRDAGTIRITSIFQSGGESAVCDLAVVDASGTVSAELTSYRDGKPILVEQGGPAARHLLGRLGVGEQNIFVASAESAS